MCALEERSWLPRVLSSLRLCFLVFLGLVIGVGGAAAMVTSLLRFAIGGKAGVEGGRGAESIV